MLCLTKVLFSSDGLVRGEMCPGAGPLSSDAPCSRAALFLAFSRTVGSSGMSPCVPLPFPYPRPSLLLGQPHVEEKLFLFFSTLNLSLSLFFSFFLFLRLSSRSFVGRYVRPTRSPTFHLCGS